jgi:DNA-binding Lrp family transcriptional regulator
MDEIDCLIAKILCEKSRTSFKEIGEKLGISTQTVMRRYKKLKKSLFTFSSITIDLEKLGFQASVSLCIKVSSGKKALISTIYDQIMKLKNVIVAIETLGPTDLLFMVPIKSFAELFSLLEQISNIEGVKEIDITVYNPHSVWPRQRYAKLLQNYNCKSHHQDKITS